MWGKMAHLKTFGTNMWGKFGVRILENTKKTRKFRGKPSKLSPCEKVEIFCKNP